MCGIAGAINHHLDISRLTKDLWHRGPDEQATFRENNLIFHHHRLAIVDIAGGKQPMEYEHLVIIFNGEIYNHKDLRDKYELQCKTHSDTETILHMYARFGADCLHELAGMFAFAIYDRKNNEVFLARDRAGKKPLFYYHNYKIFLFASELNALRHQLDVEIDDDNISQYLASGYFFKSNTPYKNVYQLPAGSCAKVSIHTAEVKLSQWWSIHDSYLKKSTDDFETALQKTDEYLHNAVKRRVESSDLEVGSFLSGGIDSGLVTAIAKEYNPSLKTFTVSFDGEYDEAPLARLVADKYQTQHYEIKIGFDNLLDDVEKILYNYGIPFFDSSAIPSYYVSKEARKYLTVILNGDGGDELFGGYRRYVPFARYDFFKTPGFVRGVAGAMHSLMPVSHNKRNKYNYIYRLLDFTKKKGIHSYYSACLDVFEGYENNIVHAERVLAEIEKDFERINNSSLTGLQKILNLDFDHILTGNLLIKMDIATMSNSLEGRSPFLGKELLDYIPSLPDDYKVKGGTTKYILRKLAEKYLPQELIHQPKRGFEIPLKKWVNNELKDMIGGYILSPNAFSRNFVKQGFVDQLWDKKIPMGEEKRAKILWTIFALDVWYHKCYLGNGKPAL